MTHCFLQLTINPQSGEDLVYLTGSDCEFTVITYEPRLGHIKMWSSRTPDVPVLLYGVLISLYSQPHLLLNGGSGYDGVIHGVKSRVLDVGEAP